VQGHKGSLQEGVGMAVHSFPELLEQLLEQPKRALSFLALVASLLISLTVLICGAIWFLHWTDLLPEEAKVEGIDIHFPTTPIDKKRSYFFVVHPQGWQETPVRLNKGDHIEIHAAGSITIDMWGINTYSTRRDAIDRAIKKSAEEKKDWKQESSVPEDFYGRPDYQQVMKDALGVDDKTPITESDGERAGMNIVQRIKPARGWTGPSGYAESPNVDTAYPARLGRRVSTEFPYGALLGTIAPLVSDDCTTEMVLHFKQECVPKRDGIFSVTRSKNPTNPSADGEERALWLIVNDVLDEKDALFPEKFFVDNLGLFYVEVVVIPGK
jgi:hypothetical protein